jgi:hypothetical protein
LPPAVIPALLEARARRRPAACSGHRIPGGDAHCPFGGWLAARRASAQAGQARAAPTRAARAQGGEHVVLDPDLKEAAAAAGALTVVATAHGEVCAVHKPGGAGISLSQARAL